MAALIKPSSHLVNFSERIFVRFHAFLILTATAIVGVLISKGLLAVGMSQLVLISLLAVVLAYCVFFILVRLWLQYVAGTIGSLVPLLNRSCRLITLRSSNY